MNAEMSLPLDLVQRMLKIKNTPCVFDRQFIPYIPCDTWISETRSTAMIHSTYFIVTVDEM